MPMPDCTRCGGSLHLTDGVGDWDDGDIWFEVECLDCGARYRLCFVPDKDTLYSSDDDELEDGDDSEDDNVPVVEGGNPDAGTEA